MHSPKQKLFLITFIIFILHAACDKAQLPDLPDGALTNWIIEEPEEIVGYVIFDPVTVESKLPSSLRFITIGELAANKIPWAMEHLSEYPGRASWGISFIEIIKTKIFKIDGRQPQGPENGAAAMWFARVRESDSPMISNQGRPFLVLEFWLPDSSFVTYMREKGHYASYGDVRLQEHSDGNWQGSVKIESLNIKCECTLSDDKPEYGSFGKQVLYPQAESGVTDIVRVVFAGHHTRQCKQEQCWTIEGEHPLASGVVLGSSSFQYGYKFKGGAYEK